MFRSTYLLIVSALLAIMVLAGVPALGNTWDVSADFSSVNNPTAVSGGWTYGWQSALGGVLVNYDSAVAPAGEGSAFMKHGALWRKSGENYEWGFIHGLVLRGYNTVAESNNACWMEPGLIVFAPTDVSVSGATTVARWTSNITGTVTITARMSGQYYDTYGDNGNAAKKQDMNGYIIKNNNAASPVFSGHIHGFGGKADNGYTDASGGSMVATYSGTVDVTPGTTIDFVSCGGTWNGSFMGLSATITGTNTGGLPGTISGIVRGNVAGTPPLAGATVQITAGGTPASTTTGTDGSFTLSAAPGTYTLTASAPTFDSQSVSGIVVNSNVNTPQNFLLNQSSIQGTTVINIANSPVVRGAVIATTDGLYSTTSDSAGNYSFKLGSGTYNFRAYKPGFLAKYFTITVASNQALTGQTVAMDIGYNFVEDWTPANRIYTSPNALANGSGPWSYGSFNQTSQAFTKYNSTGSYGDFQSATWADDWSWRSNGDWGYGDVWGGPGGYFRNHSATVQTLYGYVCEPGKIAGIPADSSQGLGADVRFTGLFGGLLQYNATWSGRKSTSSGSHGTIGVTDPNGVTTTVGQISGFAGSSSAGYGDSFGASPVLTASAPFDFVMGNTVDFSISSVAGFGWDAIQFDCTIVPAASAGFMAGKVTSAFSGSLPLGGATVTANSTTGNNTYSATTDSSGSYVLALPPDNYNVSVLAPYCQGASASYSITTGATVVRDFVLSHMDQWDLTNEFSGSINSTGQWSYGWVDGITGAFTKFDSHNFLRNVYPVTSFTGCWSATDPVSFVPTTERGIIGQLINNPPYVDTYHTASNPNPYGYQDYDAWYEPGMVFMQNSRYSRACVRWTAPDSRIISVTTRITGQSCETPDNTGVYNRAPQSFMLRKNGADMFVAKVQGFKGRAVNNFTDSAGTGSPEANFVASVPVVAGDTIDLVEDYQNGPLNYGIQEFIDRGSGVQVNTIADIKSKANGDTIFMMTPKALICDTDNFKDGSFYVEDDDRSQSIKLINSGALPKLTTDYKIAFSGVVAMVNGQKVVNVQTIIGTTQMTAPLKPVGLSSKGLSANPMGAGTNRLVKVWGKVTAVTANTGSDSDIYPFESFTINDGGQTVIIPLHNATNYWMNDPSVTVVAINDTISVTGILSIEGTDVKVYPRNDPDVYDYTAAGR